MSFPKYDRYKDSGVEWLEELPEHWSVGVLTRIAARIVVGIAEAATHAYSDEGVPILRSTNIRSGKIIGDILKIDPNFSEERGSKLIKSGDLVTVRTGNAGVTAIVPSNLDGCQCFTMLITTLNTNTDSEFYCFFVNSLLAQSYFSVEGWGTAQINISVPILKALPITIPPLPEQRSIATFLDRETTKIDELIAEQRQLIDLLKEKRQAVISHAVTKGLNPDAPMKDSAIEWLGEVPEHWEVTRLNYYSTIENGTTPSREDFKYWTDGNIPWLSSGEVNQYKVSNAAEFITAIALQDCSLRLLPKGTIIVGMIGQGKTRGMSAILEIEATINQNLAAIIPTSHLTSDYLHYIFQCSYKALREWGRGGNQAALNCEILASIRIPIPPIVEQERIINFLQNETAKLDELIAEAQHAIALLQERRTALISAAVTGKIDVRSLV